MLYKLKNTDKSYSEVGSLTEAIHIELTRKSNAYPEVKGVIAAKR